MLIPPSGVIHFREIGSSFTWIQQQIWAVSSHSSVCSGMPLPLDYWSASLRYLC